MKTTAPRRVAAPAPELHCRVALQVIAQAFGHRKHPLAYGQMRDDVVGQMCRRFDYAPDSAGRTDVATHAGVCNEKVMPAVGVAGAGKAVG